MGQKVHPIGIRLGITKEWCSTWYADSQNYADYVYQDYKIRSFLKTKLKDASVSRIQIDRPSKRASITIHTARPGIVIGKKGEDIEKLREHLQIDKWGMVLGGSWGSTLALAYAEAHPAKVRTLLLRGVFLFEPVRLRRPSSSTRERRRRSTRS